MTTTPRLEQFLPLCAPPILPLSQGTYCRAIYIHVLMLLLDSDTNLTLLHRCFC